MKTLLFVAPSVRYGGAEKNFIGIANYAVDCGYNVFLLTEEGQAAMRYIDPRIHQKTTKIDYNGNFYKRWWKAIKAIRKAVKETKADVVISFIELWRSASVIATRFSKAKCLVSERGDPYNRGKRHDKIVFLIFSLAEGHVFQTEQARDFFPNYVRKNSRVIPNPVFKDDLLDTYKGEKKNYIVSIARLDLNQKRQDLLIRAFTRISSDFEDYKLILYGDGKDEAKIRQLITELNMDNKILLMGVTRDVYNALGESKLMVLSSDFEGIPNAIIESMCVGVPVVSTRCSPGGAELLIEDGVNGLLVDCGDEEGLAKAMSYVLSRPDKAEKMIERAYEIKNRFDEKELLDKWIEYIEAL